MPDINSEYILENAPCGFLSFYPSGLISQINQTLLKWLHYSKEEVILKKNYRDILGKGGRLYYQLYVFPLLSMQGHINEVSCDLVASDNTNISCLFNASVIREEDGTIQLINASLFNITDRKKYEVEILKSKREADEEKRRFEFLANTLPSILWTTLPGGKISFLNDRFFETFNLELQNDSLTFIRNIFFPADFFSTLKSWMMAKKEEREIHWELRLKNKHGQYQWFFVRIIPCKDAEGKLSMWMGSCSDIHVQKEKQLKILKGLNLELSNASSISAHKSQLLKEVAFTQSHLVRSPVSKILGLIALLEDVAKDDETKFMVSLLLQSAEELDNIISELVTKSRSSPIPV